MAEETTLTLDEQSELFRVQSFNLARELAINWSKSAGAHAPICFCSAIDAFAQGLVAHIGDEAAIGFLDELAGALRKRGDEATKA